MGGLPTGPQDIERTRTLWFALLLTLANGFLDAHTYIARGGVFANVQTANVIFGAIDTSEGKWAAALATTSGRYWRSSQAWRWRRTSSPAVSSASFRTPLRWTMAVQAVALGDHRIRPGIGAPQLCDRADLLSGGDADRTVPQHRRPRIPAGRHHRQPDAVDGVRVRRIRREACRSRGGHSGSTAR